MTLTGMITPAILAYSTVRESATLNHNYSAFVTDNSIKVNLACANNANGADNQGTPNRVGGSKTGQCANLEAR